MRHTIRFVLGVSALVLAGCAASDDRQWMKMGEHYTKEEFLRDYKDCSRDRVLDASCMKERGWVRMNASQSEAPPPPPLTPPRGRGRY